MGHVYFARLLVLTRPDHQRQYQVTDCCERTRARCSVVGAPGMTTRDHPNLAPLMKETICWTQQLDTIFLSHTAHLRAHSAFRSTSELPSMYFGDDSLGLFRIFPGKYIDPAGCGTYDPRVRPWYTNSMSPPKDVIILIDTSGSMRANDALSHALEAARYLIEHFSPTDSFAVLAFGTRSTQIFPGETDSSRATESLPNLCGHSVLN